jgi:L-seryl-tRNA(Ser) seleniumtransferase
MATKTSDFLNGLPSVAELLERPPVRALVDRWNRSVVAGGVRSFLDELRSDVERRVAEAGMPSLRELAERAAKHVIQLQEPSLRPVVNATGRLLDSSWAGSPLADQALDRMVALGRGFVGPTAGASNDVAAALARLTGAEAATVVHTYAGAIWITLSTLAAGKEVVIGRAETGDVDPGCSLLSLAASARAPLKEVGSTNQVSVADYEAAISDRTAAICRHEPDGYRVVGDVSSADVEELVGLARDRELPLVHAVGAAPLVRGLPEIGETIRSVAAAIAAGAHVVIVRGDGLVGGPPCGIVVGHRELLRQMEDHPLFAAFRPSAISSAALAATLQLYDHIPRLAESLPVLQLLSASIDNLRQRAERLSPQLAQAPGIEAAEPIATENALGGARFAYAVWPSYAIALSVADGDLCGLEKRLRAAPVPVVGRCDGPRLVLDLRTVFPRQDQQIVDALVARDPAPAAAPAEYTGAGV